MVSSQKTELKPPAGIIGIDFSGAAHNGDALWVTQGAVYQNVLHISSCQSAREKFGATKREQTLVALRNWLVTQPVSLIGADVAFGVPKPFITAKTWAYFVNNFTRDYHTADGFKADFNELSEAAGFKELKRLTDIETQTPFSPYNLRMYRQTFYWLHDVLYPIVSEQMVCVLPMMRPKPKRSWLIEVCPAVYLKKLDLYQPYKGKKPEHLKQRKIILNQLLKEPLLKLKDKNLETKIIENTGGDALDSLIAAWVTFQNRTRCIEITQQKKPDEYFLEGYVFN